MKIFTGGFLQTRESSGGQFVVTKFVTTVREDICRGKNISV